MTHKNEEHPISLENLVFTKCCVEAISGHDPEQVKESVAPANDIEIKPHPEQPRAWIAIMRTVVNAEKDAKSPYFVNMECMAILHTDESLDEKTAKRGVLITGHSVLYGAIRETVAWLTGRQPFGPLLLGLSVLQSNQPQSK